MNSSLGKRTTPAPCAIESVGRRSGQVVRPIEPRYPRPVNANSVVLCSIRGRARCGLGIAARQLLGRRLECDSDETTPPSRTGMLPRQRCTSSRPLLPMPRHHAVPLPGDFCSAARTAATSTGAGNVPLPASSEHHCAHAPCCAGGASTLRRRRRLRRASCTSRSPASRCRPPSRRLRPPRRSLPRSRAVLREFPDPAATLSRVTHARPRHSRAHQRAPKSPEQRSSPCHDSRLQCSPPSSSPASLSRTTTS